MVARQFVLIGVTATLLWGCTGQPPDLARDFTSESAFGEHIQQRFPVGSDDSALLAELRREGFSVHPGTSNRDSFVAHFEAPGLPCKQTWTILWSADQRKISDINAHHGEICL